MLSGKDSEENVTRRFLEWAGDNPMVAHNAKFDISFIEMAMKKYNLGEFKVKGNTVYVDDKEFCRVMALSTFYQDKGIAMNRKTKTKQLSTDDKTANKALSRELKKFRTIVLDEMNAERSEKRTFDICYALVNQLENLCRTDTDRRIFMLGNTVNKYCPYFKEMGLKHISEMEPGTLDVYTYSNNKLSVAVEYSTMGNKKQEKASNPYFAFDNPKLQMITGGIWELDVYPHLPYKYIPSDILFTYFIEFEEWLLQCEIIALTTEDKIPICFTYIHEKTTPIKNANDIVFSPRYSPLPNHYRDMRRPTDTTSQKIASFFKSDKVFYQNNEIGEVVRNYLLWCKNSAIG